VLIECDDSNTTDKQQDTHVQQAELLILRYCAQRDEAFGVTQGIWMFLREEKMLVAKLAFPREFWEWNASPQTESDDIRWIVLEGEALTAFRAEDYPLQCKREDWHPDLGS
jgi:hypothetical protein